MINITKLDNAALSELAKTSAYTITGAGGDLDEWVVGYNEMLVEHGIGTPKHWMFFTGNQMNNVFNLTGKNRFKSNISFLAFDLDGLNVGKLAMFKLRMNDKWFDDLVANSTGVYDPQEDDEEN